MNLLLLGGTGFLGPHLADLACARGHTITLFHRSECPDERRAGVTHLRGDRDGGLEALAGCTFDAVVDTSSYLPRLVDASAAALHGRVGRYLYVSTLSALRTLAPLHQDEEAPLAGLDDPDDETRSPERYGGLKALSEARVRARFGDRATVVRPGLIGGPGDPTDRFTYWPVRLAEGGPYVAPGTPDDPIQVLDVRDLAAFLLDLLAHDRAGTFHATGPSQPLGPFLHALAEALGSDARPVWHPPDALAAHGLQPWSDLPAWVPAEGDTAGWATMDTHRARAAGLRCRPLLTTALDTLAWWRATHPDGDRDHLAAGLSRDREAPLLAG